MPKSCLLKMTTIFYKVWKNSKTTSKACMLIGKKEEGGRGGGVGVGVGRFKFDRKSWVLFKFSPGNRIRCSRTGNKNKSKVLEIFLSESRKSLVREKVLESIKKHRKKTVIKRRSDEN